MTLRHINPESMASNPAFSQGVVVEQPRGLLFVGGQNGVDQTHAVVSPEPAAQTEQALRNVLTVLAEVGGTQADVVKLTIYLVTGVDPRAAYTAAAQVWGQRQTAVTVLQVAGLARPDCLVEIEALAQVGGDAS